MGPGSINPINPNHESNELTYCVHVRWRLGVPAEVARELCDDLLKERVADGHLVEVRQLVLGSPAREVALGGTELALLLLAHAMLGEKCQTQKSLRITSWDCESY